MNSQSNFSEMNWRPKSELPDGVPVFSLRELEQAFEGLKRGISSECIADYITTINRSGFFYLDSHGVDEALVEELVDINAWFFSAPDDFKNQFVVQELPLRGYSNFKEESTARSIGVGDYPDLCHKYTWTYDNVAPTERFRNLWDRFQAEQQRVAQSLLRIIGETLGLAKDPSWHEIIDGQPMVRHLSYPELSPREYDNKRMAPHSDVGSITLLYQTPCANGSCGLEALIDDDFVGLPAVRGCIVVNLGETLTHITNGFIKATTHRVVSNHQPGNARTATATFFLPNAKFKLERFHGSEFQGHYLRGDMEDFQELVDEIAISFCGKTRTQNTQPSLGELP